MADQVKKDYTIAGEPFINFQAGFSKPFHVVSDYDLAGDQGEAVERLYQGYLAGDRAQTLKGVTGSGKTFTMAKLIEKIQKPTLVLSHNKTLSAQLYREFKSFFPENAVTYFVSTYDYYQPEAYVPGKDLYIEKEVDINDEIDRLRLNASFSLMERRDVIVVATVSCIYGLGNPVSLRDMLFTFRVGDVGLLQPCRPLVVNHRAEAIQGTLLVCLVGSQEYAFKHLGSGRNVTFLLSGLPLFDAIVVEQLFQVLVSGERLQSGLCRSQELVRFLQFAIRLRLAYIRIVQVVAVVHSHVEILGRFFVIFGLGSANGTIINTHRVLVFVQFQIFTILG